MSRRIFDIMLNAVGSVKVQRCVSKLEQTTFFQERAAQDVSAEVVEKERQSLRHNEWEVTGNVLSVK